MAQELFGTFGGIVENVKDPEKLGRVKVRVPHIYGASGGSTGYIGTNDIPWALPAGMPAGGSPASGGFSHLPDVGDHVWVRFLDGEPEKPIWEWGMQTINDAKGLKLHQYHESGNVVGSPKRAGWTRYGHTVELNPDGVLITTSQGYRIQLTDGDDDEFNGLISVATPLGNLLELDDDTGDWTGYVTQSLNLQVIDSIIATARALDFTLTDSSTVNIGTTLDVIVSEDATLDIRGKLTLVAGDEINVEAVGDIMVAFANLRLGAGIEPFVLGTQLSAFLTALLTWLSTHVHTSTVPGSPTSPPIIPPEGVVEPPVAELLSVTIFGE
jgi:hypothetical protein